MAKILIADDSETLRTQLNKDLVEQNHEVLQAENGLEAIAHLKATSDIQLCILDHLDERKKPSVFQGQLSKP